MTILRRSAGAIPGEDNTPLSVFILIYTSPYSYIAIYIYSDIGIYIYISPCIHTYV